MGFHIIPLSHLSFAQGGQGKVPTQEKGYNKGIPKCCGRRESVCNGAGGGGAERGMQRPSGMTGISAGAERGMQRPSHDRNFCNFFNLNNFTVSNKAYLYLIT